MIIKDYIALIRRLPPVLNFAWLVMHVGLGILIAGFLQSSLAFSLSGLGVVVAGVVIGLADGWYRKGDRGMTARFSTAVVVSLISAIFMLLVIAGILLLVVLVTLVIGEFSWGGFLQALNFFGTVTVFFLVTGFPRAFEVVDHAVENSPRSQATESTNPA